MQRRVRCLAVVFAFAVFGTAVQPRSQTPVDTVLINGVVLTVDRTDSVTQALAITGGRITAVGTTAQIKAMAGPRTEVIDLRGRAVTPGLIDAHVHFSAAASLFTVDLGDADVKSIEEVKRRVAAQVAKLKPGEWVRGRGWDEGKYAERRYITAADLDAVAPNNPVWLTHTTGHYGVANSYAMKIAEIRPATADPPAGTIDRDAKGAPTGVFKESAMGLVGRHVPPLSRDQEKQGIAEIVRQFNREGMTGAKDPGIGAAKWELYQELLSEGQLTVRVFALWSGARRLEDRAAVMARVKANPRQSGLAAGGMLVSGGVKMYMDGSGGARTAWMYDDWNRNLKEIDKGNAGYPSTDPAAYRQIVTELHNAGVHVSTHAIGDRAIDWVIDTYDEALKAAPTRGLRHGLIHANTPTDRAIDAMARLQRDYDAGYPEASAGFMWWIGDNYAGNFGPQRNLRMKPFQTYVRKGIQWAGSSDYPVTPFPARYGVWASVARRTLNATHGAQPFGTAEAVDVRTALRSYTAWAARTMFLEDRVGTIEAGKDADLAVWDRNPYAIPADQLKDMRCELTMVRGTIVYKAP
jgi:predicted amidohydrolase YtcJ